MLFEVPFSNTEMRRVVKSHSCFCSWVLIKVVSGWLNSFLLTSLCLSLLHTSGGLPDRYLLGPHEHCPQVCCTETGPWPDLSSLEGGLRRSGGRSGWGGTRGGGRYFGSLPWKTEGDENLLSLNVRKYKRLYFKQGGSSSLLDRQEKPQLMCTCV